MAAPRDEGMVTILTPERSSAYLATCDVAVVGRPFATKRAPFGPLRDPGIADGLPGRWKVGLFHAALAIPGRTDGDDVVITSAEIAASGLDYVALGHWHAPLSGRAGGVTWAYSGAPEPVAVDQDRAGSVLLVTLDQQDGGRSVAVEERRVGRTRFERLDLDAATIDSQPALIERLLARGDADAVLDVRLIGVRPDELDLHLDEVETAVRPSFLRVRVRDASRPPLTDGLLPGPDTIAGAFIRDLESRIAILETTGEPGPSEEAGELRDALRLGRLLLAGHEVTL
jgi:DNA repair exonuclease SbcCD nuclease subunit